MGVIITLQTSLAEKHIVDILPDKPTTLDAMIVTKILSQKGTNSLGDFEVRYIFEPEALKIVDEYVGSLYICYSTNNPLNMYIASEIKFGLLNTEVAHLVEKNNLFKRFTDK